MSNDSSSDTLAVLEAVVARGGEGVREVRLHLATLLVAASRADAALEHCRAVLEEDPGDVDALEIASRAHRQRGNAARADRYLSVAALLGRDPDESLEATAPSSPNGPEPAPAARVVPLRVVRGGAASGGDDSLDPEAPTIDLGAVAGMETVKRRLRLSFLAPLRNPELRAAFGQTLRGGLLLWGPPGCGKTFLARAIAGELGAKFVSIGLEDVLDMWHGRSERNLHEIFESARRNSPCVLFFDEIDALGQKRSNLRGSPQRNVVVQLLTELDGVEQANAGLYVVAATNHPWDVDTALRRPGRLGRMLLVLPPDAAAREAIVTMNLAGRRAEGIDAAQIARMTAHFSGADLVHVVESAAELALERSLDSGTVHPIAQADLVAAAREVKESTSSWLSMARNYAEFANDGGAYDDLLDWLRVRERRG